MSVIRKLKTGIRTRIFFAFFIVTSLTFVTGLIGWISHKSASDSFEEVVNVNIVALGEMAELNKQTLLLTRIAQSLVRSQTVAEQDMIWAEINHSLDNISQQAQSLKAAGYLSDIDGNVEKELGNIANLLQLINESASTIKQLEIKKANFNNRMRWITSQTLDQINDEIDTLSLTIQSQLYTDLSAADYGPLSVNSRDLGAANKKLKWLNDLRAETNYLTTLMDRAQYLTDSDSLIATEIFANSRIGSIEKILKALQSYNMSKNFTYNINQVVRLASIDDSIFKMRSQQRSLEGVLLNYQKNLNSKFDSVNEAINLEARRTEQKARYLVEETRKQALSNNITLTVIVSVSLLVSFLIGWKYVGKNIVGRILQLDKSMRDVAFGNLTRPSPIGGDDEIGAMEDSLISFHTQLEQKQQELVQAAKLAALGQLSTGIAHEINQPLVAIRNYCMSSQMLLKQGKVTSAENNIEEIKLLTVRATQIVSSLKSMARKEEQTISNIDVGDVVQEILKIMRGAIKKANVDIHIDISSYLVLADKIRLEQVLLNLVSNAIDAVANTEIKTIKINSWAKDGWVSIEVYDSGEGVADESAEHLFEAFFTTKESGKGLGLGLAISYNIIRNLGGELFWKRGDQLGTSFIIKLREGN